mmetsp:Transcript_15675/g.51298  ORF Transcript_15675/g.51298 Transcript_15675/m.51298 type:complete len:319 (-) Transcript_15675:11-967(-)
MLVLGVEGLEGGAHADHGAAREEEEGFEVVRLAVEEGVVVELGGDGEDEDHEGREDLHRHLGLEEDLHAAQHEGLGDLEDAPGVVVELEALVEEAVALEAELGVELVLRVEVAELRVEHDGVRDDEDRQERAEDDNPRVLRRGPAPHVEVGAQVGLVVVEGLADEPPETDVREGRVHHRRRREGPRNGDGQQGLRRLSAGGEGRRPPKADNFDEGGPKVDEGFEGEEDDLRDDLRLEGRVPDAGGLDDLDVDLGDVQQGEPVPQGKEVLVIQGPGNLEIFDDGHGPRVVQEDVHRRVGAHDLVEEEEDREGRDEERHR